MKNEEIVRALRCGLTHRHGFECEQCPYLIEVPAPEGLRETIGSDVLHRCDTDRLGMDGADLIEKLADRLAAYEDTGLTPEEINDLASVREISPEAEYAINKHADRDGRLVVLPCKVGDTLWVTGRDNMPREMELEAPDIRAVCTDEDNLCMSTCNRKPDGFCAYRLRNDGADVGKTVFLTREEAEKALEAKSND